jgi:NADH:ubiquinone oxidoreductase subunit 5 (subunit L)/multisubunit Na+/H+ antiporter MnhA subunit/multisubunit Na+/H+ antiporter MnhB subunit
MTGADLVLPAIVAIPFVAAVAILLLGRRVGPRVGAGMVLAAAASLSLAGWVAARVAPGEALVFHADWMPSLGVGLTLRADGFGLLFALLISGIGVLVGAYALAYVGDLEGGRLGRFYAALAAFMGAMLGIALADDLILLFVFWEITSLTSFVLIGFWYEREIARQGAVTALLVTALGGLAMLAGFVLIGQATGTHRLSALATDPTVQQTLRASPVFVPALLLVLAGAFTKSAQVPFHFWLPGAMVAPTPVSTYLHAATMVKAGIFLLGRMFPVFGTADAWFPILTSVGFATFWLGNYRAFREDDLKGLLAYTTVATLGAFTMMYGLGAAKLDALQVLSHATYKGALFLVAGIVEHAAHSRSLRDLGGLRRRLPITFAIAVLAGLSMAGLPPFLGFLAKEGVYAELLATPRLAAPGLRVAVIAAMVVSNALLFAVACKFVCGVFLGAPRAGTPHGSDEHRAEDHGETPGLWLPPAILAALALVLGLLALTPVTESVAQRFASDPHGHAHVALVPTETGPLLLSLLTIALGALLYAGRATVERVQDALAVAPSMQRVWDGGIAAITMGAEGFCATWQNGSLRWYFSCALAFSVGLVAFGFAHGGLALGTATPGFANVTWYGVTLAGLLLANTVIVATAKTRLAAALGLTGVGFLVALIFVVYRSPDIVLTQILIETVSTIFVLLVLYFMPVFRPRVRALGQTVWNGALSLAVGSMMFVLVVFATSFRATSNIGQDYLARSLTDAGGANAVNVIIVDFRALDTQGEITVLVVVGLCVYGLLRARRRRSA